MTAVVAFRWVVLVMSLGVAVFNNYPAFLSDFVVTDDARANIFWFHSLNDPELLQNDLLTDFAVYYEATGVKYLYTLASAVMDPFLLEKIVPIVLYVLVGFILYELGVFLRGPYCGFLFALFFVVYPGHLEAFNAGYSRIFAYPGAVLCIYFLTTRRPQHMLWLSPVMALFYPIVFLINSLTYFFWVVIRVGRKKAGIEPRRLIIQFLIAMTLSAAFVVPKYAFSDERFGRLLTHEETLANPGAYKNGRNVILPPQPVHEKYIDALDQPFVIIAFVVILLLLRRKALDVPLEFWLYMASGLILYELAYVFLLKLYFPYKYFRYSFPFVMFFIIALGLGRIVERAPSVAARIALLAFLTGAGHFFYGSNLRPGVSMDDYSPAKPLYDHLKTLPKDALIAAPPYLSDGIPLFAARKVFFNHELASPWFTGYARLIKERIEDFYFAYYSDKPEDFARLKKKHGVDYIIADDRDFKKLDRRRFYINPYNDFIKARARENKGRHYLPSRLKGLSQFRFGHYYVIDLEQDSFQD